MQLSRRLNVTPLLTTSADHVCAEQSVRKDPRVQGAICAVGPDAGTLGSVSTAEKMGPRAQPSRAESRGLRPVVWVLDEGEGSKGTGLGELRPQLVKQRAETRGVGHPSS